MAKLPMQNAVSCPEINQGKQEQCQGCPNQIQCSTLQPDELLPFIQNKMLRFKLIFCIMSGKGGVGKSTITRNIAECLSLNNKKVLLLDLDLTGPSIPKTTNTEGSIMIESNMAIYPVKISNTLSIISMGYVSTDNTNINYMSSSFKTNFLRNLFLKCEMDDFEMLIIDTPPNIADEHIEMVKYFKINFAIIVTTPQLISFQDVKRQCMFCQKNNITILGIIENMKEFECGKCKHKQNIFNDIDIKYQCNLLNVNYLGSIPLDIKYGQKSDLGCKFQDKTLEHVVNLIQKQLENDKIV